MKPKHRAQHTSLKLFDWKDSEEEPNVDPLCRELFGVTEREFFAMFEQPSGPES